MALDRLHTYGESLFHVYAQDLDRLARWIHRKGAAQDMTTMLRRFLRGRLRYGPERVSSASCGELIAGPAPEGYVRFWDPAKVWRAGDWAVFPEPLMRSGVRVFTPRIGRILRLQGGGATVRIDGRSGTRVLGLASSWQGGEALAEWRTSVEELVRALPYRNDEASLIDYALYTYGDVAATNLLIALGDDRRFVLLEGSWFLRYLAAELSRQQIEGLALAMLAVDRPMGVQALMPLVPPPVADGAPGCFGLALSLQEHPDLFEQVGDVPQTRWALCSPPDSEFTAHLAAYDPETGHVLCEPGEVLDRRTVERLWALGLLKSVAGS